MPQMRAWEFRGNRDIALVERDVPEPGPHEVRVRIAYVGICGTDLHEFYEGPVVTSMVANPITGAVPPIVPGHEAAGVVDAIGAEADGVAIGDHVAIEPIIGVGESGASYNVDALFYGYHAHGFLADFAVVKRSSLHLLPSGVPLADGALAEPLAVAVHAAKRVPFAQGQRVVIFGAGPIGVCLALVLRGKGAVPVVIEPSGVRAAALRTLGVTVVDPRGDGFDRELAAALGGPASLVFDAAGAPGVLEQAIALLAPQGAIVLVATYSTPPALDLLAMLGLELSLYTVNAYNDGDFDEAIALLASGRVGSAGWVETVRFEDAVGVGFPKLRSAAAAKVLVRVSAVKSTE